MKNLNIILYISIIYVFIYFYIYDNIISTHYMYIYCILSYFVLIKDDNLITYLTKKIITKFREWKKEHQRIKLINI